MTDARLSASFPTHPKTKKLMRRLGAAGPWALICLFLWARMNRADGNLTGMTDEDVELACDWSGDEGALVAALVSVGFIDGDEGERRIHDWAEHQPWSAGAEDRKQSSAWAALCKRYGRDGAAQRMPEYAERMRKPSDPHAEMVRPACDPHATGSDSACGTDAPLPSPSPSPLPTSKSLVPADAATPPKVDRSERLATVTRDAVAAYNESLAKPRGLLAAVTLPDSDTRRANVKRCLRVAALICQDQFADSKVTPEFWRAYFASVKCDPFLSGAGPYSGSHANWRPDFEYLTRPETVEKVFDKAVSA